MKKAALFSLVFAMMLLSSGCTQRLTDFTVISTKNVPIGGYDQTKLVKGTTRVKGEDCAHMILFIPTGTPNMKEAIDRAIESTPGAIGLVDGVVKSSFWYALLYGKNKYIVEGTPLFEEGHGMSSRSSNVGMGNYNMYNQPAQNNNMMYNQPAAPAVQQQPVVSGTILNHVVKSGETLAAIAGMYNVSVADIVKWNNLTRNIVEGETLRIVLQ